MAKEFEPLMPKETRQPHNLRWDDRIWERLGVIADLNYEGSRSKAVEGLIIFEWLVSVAKRILKQPHNHWLTAPITLRKGELEPLLQALVDDDIPKLTAYLEDVLEELRKIPQPPSEHCPPL